MKELKELSLNITELEYRNLDKLSYSLLSSISKDSHKALTKVFVPTVATKYGILVESILFGDFVREDYYIMNVSLGEKLNKACDIIFPKLLELEKIDRNLNSYINEIIQILDNNKIDYYENKNSQTRANTIIKQSNSYWQEYVKSIGKILITELMLNSAKKAANTLRTHSFTENIFSKDSFFNIEKESQVKLTFNYKGYEFKSMLDWLIIDHDNKIIRPYDLKTGSKSVEEFENSYFYWRYDIQAYLYTLALVKLKNENYPDYTIDNFKFVYISRFDSNRPLIWVNSSKQLEGTLKGFYKDNVYYKGIIELVQEYEWYTNNKDVEYSKEVYDNSGEILITDNIIIKNAENRCTNK